MRGLLIVLLFAGAPLCAAGPSEAEVRAAVKRGVVWLKRRQEKDGSFGSQPGETALALLALRHSGVPASDPACLRAARQLEGVLPDGKCYSAALGTLALLAQSPERHKKEVRRLVDGLVRGQCKNGQWSYKLRRTGRRPEGDNSNTQIAILALYSARVRGVEVPRAPFELLHRHLVASQNSDGGFGYSASAERSYASMTAGCAMSLALCTAVVKREPVHAESVRSAVPLRRAYAWLAREFDVKVNRGAGRARSTKRKPRNDRHWRHYWLWSLERACGVTRTAKLGAHDWYADGARFLLANQRKDGNWRDPESDGLATSFALLFLGRKTSRTVTPRDRDAAVTPTR
jgi:hypothetical protein